MSDITKSIRWREIDKDQLAVRLADLHGLDTTKKRTVEILSEEFSCSEITRGKLDRVERRESYITATEERVNRFIRAERSTLKTKLSKITDAYVKSLTRLVEEGNVPAMAQYAKIMGYEVVDEKKQSDQPLQVIMAGNFTTPENPTIIEVEDDTEKDDEQSGG